MNNCARNRKMGKTISVAAAMLLALLACGKPGEQGPAKAPTPAAKALPAIWNALPDSTVFAVALTDLDRWRSDLKKTALNDAWEDPNLKTWRETSWPKFKKIFADKTGVTAEEIDSLLHGDALFVAGFVLEANQREPQPRAAFLVRPSTNKAALEAFVQKMLARLNTPKLVSRWAGDVLILAQDEPLATELAANLQSGRSPLEGSKAHGVLKTRYAPDGFAHVWVNCEKLMGLIVQGAQTGGQPQVKAGIDQAGLSNLVAIYAATSVRQKGFLSTARVQCDGPRQGILAWVGESAPSKAIRLVPAETASFFSLRHAGVDKILDGIHSIAMTTPGFTEQQWQQALAQAGAPLGINVQTDLPRMIGKELAVSAAGGMGLNVQFNLYVESPNAPQLIAALERVLTAAQIQPSSAEYQGTTYKYFTVPRAPLPFEISYGQVGDFLVVSSQQQGVRSAIETSKSKKSLADSPDYVTAMAEVGKPGWSESFMGVASGMGAQAAMFGPLLVPQINKALGSNLAFGDIPNLQVFSDHQMPGVGRGRAETDAIELQRYGTFGVGASAPMAGIAMAVAVPGFMRAREVSRATSCQENLIRLEGSVDQWAVENDKKDGDTVAMEDLVGPTKYLKRTPRCRAGGHYPDVLTVGKTPTCDYKTPAWFDTKGNMYKHAVPDSSAK